MLRLLLGIIIGMYFMFSVLQNTDDRGRVTFQILEAGSIDN